MKGFGIEIKNDLLEKKHVDAMGNAVWLYMFLIDKMTSISEEGIGKVLGGRPVKYPEVKAELGLSERTYTRWIDSLRDKGYIQTTRTPYGVVFHVNKAFKRFGKRYANVGGTDAESSVKNGGTVPSKTADVIKTDSVDITKEDNATPSVAPPRADSFFQKTVRKERKDDGFPMTLSEFVLMCRGSQYRHIRLIGEYADEREFAYATRGQWRQFGIRHLKPASRLAPFNDRQIADAIIRLHKDFSAMERKTGARPKWGMETIEKYLEEANAKVV